ncbi:MAG TPA: 16S rRNA processing protein RimM [Candidatus Marinimicrobia bacterium]|nr:16S rRNA processing protein RimM [Candidatus Neomarinimicrobiota bacterium]
MNKLFPIGKVVRATGMKGAVSVRPLSRYFDDYVHSHPLHVGFSEEFSSIVQLSDVIGAGKKRRFIFTGMQERDSAETMVGQTIFAVVDDLDAIHFVSGDLIGYDVVTDSGRLIGELGEILWLPANDAYVIYSGDQEFLIPIIPEIVKEISHTQRAVMITPMEGLLD